MSIHRLPPLPISYLWLDAQTPYTVGVVLLALLSYRCMHVIVVYAGRGGETFTRPPEPLALLVAPLVLEPHADAVVRVAPTRGQSVRPCSWFFPYINDPSDPGDRREEGEVKGWDRHACIHAHARTHARTRAPS
jgi:hypothetical protein